MNKKKIGAIVSGFFFVAFIVVLVLLLCGVFDDKDNFEATRIELDVQNTQTEFYVGEVFNSDNLIVTVFNEEEESKKVEDFSVDSAEFNSGKIGEYSINVYYQDVFATYKVKVISAEQFLTKILNSEETKAFAQSVTSLSIDQGAKNAEYKVLNDEFYINNGLDSEQWGGKGYIYTRNDENYLMERFDQETFLKSVAGEDFQIEQDWTYVQNLTYAFSVEPLKELQAKLGKPATCYHLVHCGGRLAGIGDRKNEMVAGIKRAIGDTPFIMEFTFGEYGYEDDGRNTTGGLMLSFTAFGK